MHHTSAEYDASIAICGDIFAPKLNDTGAGGWRNIRFNSLAHLILVKLLRVKQFEDSEGQTVASEGIDVNCFNIINNAIFALIPTTGK